MNAKTPIEIMLDKVDWKPIYTEGIKTITDYPIATHSGILKIADIELRVYQLNNGQRVIEGEDIEKFFGVK